jgi:hypothetical protein
VPVCLPVYPGPVSALVVRHRVGRGGGRDLWKRRRGLRLPGEHITGRTGFGSRGNVGVFGAYLRYAQNLPILRCVEMLGAEGVPLSEEMVHTLVRVTAERIAPVVEAVADQVRLATLVNLDDTQVRA